MDEDLRKKIIPVIPTWYILW